MRRTPKVPVFVLNLYIGRIPVNATRRPNARRTPDTEPLQ